MNKDTCKNLIKKVFALKDRIVVEKDWDIELNSENELFKFISPDFLNKYQYFIDLFSIYEPINNISEEYNQEELNKIDIFLEKVLESPQGETLKDFLVQEINFQSKDNVENVKKFLFNMWFTLYGRDSRYIKDSCGFEHVFLGEVDDELSGYHNWIKFYIDQQKKNIISNIKILKVRNISAS